MDPHFKDCNYHMTPCCYFRPYISQLRYALEYMDRDLPTFLKLKYCFCKHHHRYIYKYIRISDSFCLCFFFSWHKSFTQSKKRSSHIQTAILPLQDESRNGQESNACQIMAICKKVNSKLFSLCRTLSFN